MADFENPLALKLGRVDSGIPLARAQPMPAQTSSSQIVSGLVGLGKELVGASIKQQRAKEFYEGQNRIIEASLQGTQQEELKRVIDEQPYYMQLLGNGAVADGAIEAASRVGAGRIFNEQAARLAEGLDADVDPATYRENLHGMIKSQMTGDERVDSIFIPQMVQKAQSIMATHMEKHLEHNAKVAQTSMIQSSYDAINTFNTVLSKENGEGARFLPGMPVEAFTPAVRASYQNLVDSFNPENLPKNLDRTKAIEQVALLANSAAELGDGAVVQAVYDSGLFKALDAKQIDAFKTAAIKGKKAADSRTNLQNLRREMTLTERIFNAKTQDDVDWVLNEASAIAADYDMAGITRPDMFKDADAIRTLVFRAVNNKEEAIKQAAARNERLSLVAAKAQAESDDQDSLDVGIITNSLGGNPKGKVFLKATDGSSGFIEPSDSDVKDAYLRASNKFAGLDDSSKAAFLKRYGLKGIEELAWRMQVVDEPKQAKITSLLSTAYGKTLGQANSPKEAQGTIEQFFAHVGDVVNSIPNRADVAKYIKDDDMRKEFMEFMEVTDATGDWKTAWNSTFGRDHSVKVDFDKRDLDEKIEKNSDVKALLQEYGNDYNSGMFFIKQEARRLLESRVAKDVPTAIKQARRVLEESSEVIGDKRILAVPPAFRISERIGVRNQQTVSAVTDTYVKSTLPNFYDYFLDFNPTNGMHYVIPVNEDGVALANNTRPLDYASIKRMVNDSNYLSDVQSKDKARKQYKPLTNNPYQNLEGAGWGG